MVKDLNGKWRVGPVEDEFGKRIDTGEGLVLPWRDPLHPDVR